MCPIRQAFVHYTPLEACFVTIANNEKIQCAGRGTVFLKLHDKTVKLQNVLHVPDLEMTPLLSVRSHRRRGQGCSFVADETGCFLTFPKFVLEIDDTDDCVIPCRAATTNLVPNYDESDQTYSTRFSRLDTFRISAKHTQGTTLTFGEGQVRHVGVPPHAAVNPAELVTLPSTSKPDLSKPPVLERCVPPPVRPSEVPESSAAAVIRYTPQQLHKLLGCCNIQDYKQLQDLGTGLPVADLGEPLLSVGVVVNIQRGRHGRSLKRPKQALDVVGMDSVSADYKLDGDRAIAAAFPDVRYDGGLYVGLYSNPDDSDVEPFPIGAEVFAKISEEPNGDATMSSTKSELSSPKRWWPVVAPNC
jgi:hypothetical protein